MEAVSPHDKSISLMEYALGQDQLDKIEKILLSELVQMQLNR
jgi:hypothetical protein